MPFSFSQTSISNIKSLKKVRLQEVLGDAIGITPIDFAVTCGTRTTEEQFELYKKGRRLIAGRWVIVNKKKVVTYLDGFNERSAHQDGKAFDIVAYVDGQYTYEPQYLYIIAGVILSCAARRGVILKWGATFGKNGDKLKGWDLPHFEQLGHG
jgi:peptidoglycan L-alanyl-D-glutamate endopeptidase CwlK